MRRMSKLGRGLCVAALILACCGDSSTSPDNPLFGTWLWNGSSWTQLARSSGSEAKIAPWFSGGENLTYWKDFGGLVDADGTYWSGSMWVASAVTYPASPTPSPIADQETGSAPGEPTALVLDVGRNQLLFLDPNSQTMSAWSNGTWKEVVSPAQWPKARYLRGVAYDPARQEVVILTCCDVAGPGPGPQTSIWTGKALIQAPGLPSGNGYKLVPDGNGHMLAFGDSDGFSWDGHAWSALGGVAGLPGNGGVSAVRDDTHGEILAVGQSNNSNTIGVWQWQDGKWHAITAKLSPPGGCHVSNPVYDPELLGIVITDLWADCNVGALP